MLGTLLPPDSYNYRAGAGFVVGASPKVFGSGSAFKYYLLRLVFFVCLHFSFNLLHPFCLQCVSSAFG
jgi:hypothetical protein